MSTPTRMQKLIARLTREGGRIRMRIPGEGGLGFKQRASGHLPGLIQPAIRRGLRRTGAFGGFALGFAAVACAAGLLLGGCAVGPNFHPPKTEVASAFGHGNQTNLDSGQVISAWWKGFGDGTLDRLVDLAVATNQDLRIATARVREARALHANSVADAFPVVNAGAGWEKSVSSKDSSPFPLSRDQRTTELFATGFDATWELDVFGRVRRSIQATSAELAATEAGRQYVLVSVVAEVARNYFELRGSQNLLAVARSNAENQKETLDLTEAKLKAGRATELDTARSRSQLNATLAVIPPLETSVYRAIHRLSVLTGQQPTALESELLPPAQIPASPPLVTIGDPAGLLRRRPDIRAAEQSLAAATARIGVNVAQLFPVVTFNGNIGFSAKDFTGLGKSGTDTYAFGPQITWAALDLGHVLARIRGSKARAEGELAAYEKTVLNALEETENALVEFGRVRVRREYLAESVRSATQATELARQRYEGGVADFLPVLDAQRTQLAVEAELADSQTRTATSLVAVYKALGGGWDVFPGPGK